MTYLEMCKLLKEEGIGDYSSYTPKDEFVVKLKEIKKVGGNALDVDYWMELEKSAGIRLTAEQALNINSILYFFDADPMNLPKKTARYIVECFMGFKDDSVDQGFSMKRADRYSRVSEYSIASAAAANKIDKIVSLYDESSRQEILFDLNDLADTVLAYAYPDLC